MNWNHWFRGRVSPPRRRRSPMRAPCSPRSACSRHRSPLRGHWPPHSPLHHGRLVVAPRVVWPRVWIDGSEPDARCTHDVMEDCDARYAASDADREACVKGAREAHLHAYRITHNQDAHDADWWRAHHCHFPPSELKLHTVTERAAYTDGCARAETYCAPPALFHAGLF